MAGIIEKAKRYRDNQIRNAQQRQRSQTDEAKRSASAKHTGAMNDQQQAVSAATRQADMDRGAARGKLNEAQALSQSARNELERNRQALRQYKAESRGHMGRVKGESPRAIHSDVHAISAIPEDTYQTVFNLMNQSGFRPAFFNAFTYMEAVFFNVIFQKEKKAWQAFHNQSASDIQARMGEMRARKYRLCNLYGYQSGGTDRYAAVFVNRDMHDWQGFVGMSAGDHQNRMRAMQAARYRLVNQSVLTVRGQRYFSALYDQEKPHDGSAQLDLDGAGYQAAFDANVRQKRTLADLDVESVNGQPRFFPVWTENHSDRDLAHHGMNSDSYHAALRDCQAQKMESRILVGYQSGEAMLFAGYWAK